MHFCSIQLVFVLLSIILLQGSVRGVQQNPDQHIDQSMFRTLVALQRRPAQVKEGAELTMKLLQMNNLTKMENEVMEPKRKRSFPGNDAPLDRLSISLVETKQGRKKQSKVGELPRRRDNLPPIDRIGRSRLPNSRG